MIEDFGISQEPPNIMWIDLNSAFATTEQQAHPSLRGRPVGITNRISRECCIITASYEAKNLGVKVGMRRSEALKLCPNLILLESDPPKYHAVYRKLFAILGDYSPKVQMRSIDEGMIDFHGTPLQNKPDELVKIGYQIKQRVRQEIGDYMMINVGIGQNRFLAKMAASLHKPDGLDLIDHTNLISMYQKLKLTDLTGIAAGYERRLRLCNILTPLDFLAASEQNLQQRVFHSINGLHWYKRLRGFEVDDYKTNLGMIGRQWVVHSPTNDNEYLRSCLHSLSETIGTKLRYRDVEARGVCVWMKFCEGGKFSDKQIFSDSFFTDQDIWDRISNLFENRPKNFKPRIMGVYLYGLVPSSRNQLQLFEENNRASFLSDAMDDINNSYGLSTIHSAESMVGAKSIKQKIPFGGTDYFRLLLQR